MQTCCFAEELVSALIWCLWEFVNGHIDGLWLIKAFWSRPQHILNYIIESILNQKKKKKRGHWLSQASDNHYSFSLKYGIIATATAIYHIMLIIIILNIPFNLTQQDPCFSISISIL